MAHVESVAPVIDLEVLLQPISEENPSGESLQYSGLYDEIREARRADLVLEQGQWQHELKVANYRQVINLAVPALTSQTKDLQIVAWLSEALIREHGFVGLRDSLRLMDGLMQNFWETCFPEIDEGDQEGRANAVEWMDKQGSEAIQTVPMTAGAALSFIAWEESKRFDIPDNLDSFDSSEQEKFAQLRAEAEKFNRTTSDKWRKAKAQTRRAFYETANLTLDECWESYATLDRTIEEKFDRNQMPGMNSLKKILDTIRTAIKKFLQEKRQEEPDPEDSASANGDGVVEGATASEGGVMVAGGVMTATGAVRSRQDALKRLSDVAEFFRQTEPHSPVSYLVQRAVKWGSMPLDGWLQEVIKDENVLGQLRETLGVGGYSGDSGSSGSSDSSSYDSTAESSDSSW
jgi:type VI secretion system protein ImpA